jgi:hypothetical protein
MFQHFIYYTEGRKKFKGPGLTKGVRRQGEEGEADQEPLGK